MADCANPDSDRSSIARSEDSNKPAFDAQSSVEDEEDLFTDENIHSSEQSRVSDALCSGSGDEYHSSSPENQYSTSPAKPSSSSSCGEVTADQGQPGRSEDDPHISAYDRTPSYTDQVQHSPHQSGETQQFPHQSGEKQQFPPYANRSSSDQQLPDRPPSSTNPTFNIASTLDELKIMASELEAISAFEKGLKFVLKLLISQVTEIKTEQFHQNQNLLMRHEQIMKNIDDARTRIPLKRDSNDSLYGPSESDSEHSDFPEKVRGAVRISNAEILPPPTPNSELEEEEPHNGHQDTMMEEEKPPITPEPEERREPLVRQDSKDSTGSREDYKIRRPSTIFSPSGDGSVVSPWGPPTKSMKKKKGWIEPEKPVTVKPKQEIKKIVADTNELFNVFERRNKGESISKSITDKDAPRTDEKAISEIGGNIHMRISFSQPATLHVEVKQADDLVVSIKNKTCNPYAVVTLLGEYEVFKTEVVTKSQSPVWNQTFDFALPLKFLQTTAVLVVLYNKHGESHEEFLGEVHISLAAYKHFKVIDSWYALEDLRGEEAKFDGYKELQKVLRSLKTKAPMSLPDTLRQDELRKEENFNSY